MLRDEQSRMMLFKVTPPTATIEHMLETVDRLTDRIGALESILDDDHPQWRQKVGRHKQGKEEV